VQADHIQLLAEHEIWAGTDQHCFLGGFLLHLRPLLSSEALIDQLCIAADS